jgi:hypothetical protein
MRRGFHVGVQPTDKSLCRLRFLIGRSKLLGMKRQHTRQQDSTYFAVTVPRDRSGYEVVTRTVCGDAASGTLAGGNRREGEIVVEIVGKSGEIESVRYKTGSHRLPIWPKLRNLTYPGDIAGFMSKWGVIDRSLGTRSEYVASVDSLLQLVGSLKYLAAFVESNDIDGFLGALRDRTVFHGTLRPEAEGRAGRLVGEASSLAQFLILEMWLDFGGERPSRGGIKACRWCNQPFRAGGRRKINGSASGCRILFEQLPQRGQSCAGQESPACSHETR